MRSPSFGGNGGGAGDVSGRRGGVEIWRRRLFRRELLPTWSLEAVETTELGLDGRGLPKWPEGGRSPDGGGVGRPEVLAAALRTAADGSAIEGMPEAGLEESYIYSY